MRRVVFHVLLVMGVAMTADLQGAPPADQLLPATTKGYLSLPRVGDFRARWQQTQLGKLSADPIMQPFAEDLKAQVREKFIESNFHVSLSWDELVSICGGELCVASIQPDGDPKQHASVLVVDVTGHREEAQQILEKAAGDLKQAGAQRRTVAVGEHQLVIHELPRQRGELAAHLVVRSLANDTLVVGDHPQVCQQILQRLVSQDSDQSLSKQAAYQAVMQRVQQEAGALAPQLCWYLDPFGYAEVVRAARLGPKKRGKDMLTIFKNQGFDTIQALGGWVHLATDEHEVLHRTFIYAPKRAEDEARFQLAARLLEFPNQERWEWPAWIPREMATVTSFYCNLRDGFEHSKTLVDAIAGDEGFFEDLLDSLKNDPAGPQIDVRRDFVDHMRQQVTVMSDYVFPITPQSERILVAIAVENEEAVRKTVQRTLENDPKARRVDVDGSVIWEYREQTDEDAPNLDLQIDGIEPIGDAPEKDEEVVLPNSAVTVAHGHFIVSTHVDFLQVILKSRPPEELLTSCEDWRLVHSHLEKLGAGADSLRYFSRTDEEYRPTYELIRLGKMPESESVLGRILNRILGPDDEDVRREQKIRGGQLPEFDAIRRYLGPAGCYSRTVDDGWFVTGVLLNKQARYVDGSLPTAVTASRDGTGTEN